MRSCMKKAFTDSKKQEYEELLSRKKIWNEMKIKLKKLNDESWKGVNNPGYESIKKRIEIYENRNYVRFVSGYTFTIT